MSLTLAPHLPKTFLAKFKEKIAAATGYSWVIDVVAEGGGQSLMEQTLSEHEIIKQEFIALPTIQKLLKKFPQTTITVEE